MIFVLAAVVGILGLLAFVGLEERGRLHVVVLIVMFSVILDPLIYPNQAAVPDGPFRIFIGGQDFRLADLLVAIALVAHLLVRGFPRRITGAGLAWTAFFGVFGFGAVLGFANHHDATLVFFQAKLILEAGGMAVLVAAVPAEFWTRPEVISRSAWTVGLLSVVPIAVSAANANIALPLFPQAALGELSPDAATLLLSVGLLLLLVEACTPEPRATVVGWSMLLILGPLFAGQRAALVGMAVALISVLVLMSGRVWQRRSRVRLTQFLPLLGLIVIPIGAASILVATSDSLESSLPFVSTVQKTFDSQGKQQSADIRLVVWRLGKDQVSERPFLGWGLGQDFSIFQSNGNEDPFTGGDYHNIAVDIAVTTGVTGLALFGLAVSTSLWSAFGTWQRARRSTIAALAAAAAIVLVQLCAKGMFESTLQKFRLNILLGFVIGVIAAAAASPSTAPAQTTDIERASNVWT